MDLQLESSGPGNDDHVHVRDNNVEQEVERAVIENIPDLSSATCENRNTVRKSQDSDPPPSPQLLVPVTSSSSRTTAHTHTHNAPLRQQAGAGSKGTAGSTWACNVCGEIFLDCVQLEAHSSELHGDEYPSECVLCHSRFVTDKELGTHIKQSHFLGSKSKSPFVKEVGKVSIAIAGPDGNSNSIILTSHNSNKPKPAAPPVNSNASAPEDPKVEPLRIQTNVLNSTTAIVRSHDKSSHSNSKPHAKANDHANSSFSVISRPNPPLKTYSRVPPKSSPSIVVPISDGSDPCVHCFRCGRNFADSETWTYHVVNFHIKNRNPYPIVAMNNVDKRSLRRNSTNSVEKNLQVTEISAHAHAKTQAPTSQPQPSAKPNEELKLKIAVCRRGSDSSERKSYTILKRPSNLEPEDKFPVLVTVPASPLSPPPSASAINSEKLGAEDKDKEADAITPITKESSKRANSTHCSEDAEAAGHPPGKRARTDSKDSNECSTGTTVITDAAIAVDKPLPSQEPEQDVKRLQDEESAANASDETKTCTSNSSSSVEKSLPLHNSDERKVINKTDYSHSPPPAAKTKSDDKAAVDPQPTPPPRDNEVSTIRKGPTAPSTSGREVRPGSDSSSGSSSSDSDSEKHNSPVSAATGIIKEIISSASSKPLLRPITIGSMSIIPTDYSSETETDHNHSDRQASSSNSTLTTIIEEPGKDDDDETQPESILPLTEDDLERRTLISEDAKNLSGSGVTVVDIQTTITSEANNRDPSPSPAGMLAKKKQFITAMVECENRDRHCNGGNVSPTPTDLSLSSRERNNHKSTNTSPETNIPNSAPTASPQFENITPPNSEEGEHEQGDESENVVIHVRPEDISLGMGGDHRQTDDQAPHAPRVNEEQNSVNPEARTFDDHDHVCQSSPGAREEETDQQNESDDFKCTMCDKNFTSDAELHAHFNEEHLRIGSTLSNSNIFEPESPYPVQQNERETSQELIAEPCFASHEAQRLVEMEHRRALIVETQRRHSSEILSQTLIRGSHVGASASMSVNHSQFRPSSTVAPSLLQQQMLRPQGSTHLASVLFENAGSLSRPQFAAAAGTGSRFPNPQNANSRLAAAMQQQQLQSRHSNSIHQQPTGSAGSGNVFPSQQTVNNLQNLRYSQAQQAQQQQLQASRANFNGSTSGSLQRSLSTESNARRPAQIVRHNSLDQDGPRIVEVSSGGRTIQTNETYPSALQQHLLVQQTQLNNAQQERRAHAYNWNPLRASENQIQNLLHAKRMASMEAQSQVQGGGSPAKQPRLDSNGNHLRSQSHLNQQQQQQQSQLAMAMSAGRQQPYSQMEVRSVPMRTSPPGSTVERETNLANNTGLSSVRIGNAITLSVCPTTENSGSGTMTMTRQDSCSASASANPLFGSSSSFNSTHLNPDSVAVALANRGVTVTPAIADQIPGPRRSPVNISISNATDLRHSPRATLSPISPSGVMNRMQVQSPPVQQQHSPTHQFAVPRAPGPRILYTTATVNSAIDRPDRPPTVDLTEDEINQQVRENSARMQQMQMQAARQALMQAQTAQVQPSAVNLTQGANSNQAKVPGSRAAYACRLCGALCPTEQSLEEHKMNQHGISPGQLQLQHQQQRVGPLSMTGEIPQRMQNSSMSIHRAGPGRPPGPRQMQAHQQQISQSSTLQVAPRPATATRTAQQGSNNMYLYIPLIDMTRLDQSRIRRLEDLGILSMMPLHGNERTGTQMGIPVISLRPEVVNQHLPWDSVLPAGPVTAMSVLAGALPVRSQQQQLNGQSMATIHHHQR